VRFNALTMPLVTVLDRPSGAPNAITGSPISRDAESPRGIVRSPAWPLILMTARSVSGSRPVIVARAVFPLPKVTSAEPLLVPAADHAVVVRV
jgi:hypothetical protein